MPAPDVEESLLGHLDLALVAVTHRQDAVVASAISAQPVKSLVHNLIPGPMARRNSG